MPNIEANKTAWENHDWSSLGEEWSSAWGSATNQWLMTVFSRIHKELPTGVILEIAPGYGRWTWFLKDYCRQLIGVDLSENCVEACKNRFKDFEHLSFFQNDGLSLPNIGNSSVDFIFSFDSLVHADPEVLDSYVNEFARVLKPGGKAFIHHSNLGEYLNPEDGVLKVKNSHWRSESMTAKYFSEICDKAGLFCFVQEKIGWGETSFLNDCFSFVQKGPINPHYSKQVFENLDLWRESSIAQRISDIYGKG